MRHFVKIILLACLFTAPLGAEIYAQQSAESSTVVHLEKQTPRGPKSCTIIEGRSVIGVKEKDKPVVRGRVHAITDSTFVIGRNTVRRDQIVYLQGTLGRNHLNLWMIALPSALLLFCLVFGGIFFAAQIAGAWWLANNAIGGILFALGFLGAYLFIPFLVLWIDSVVRFFMKLYIPEPWNFRGTPLPAKKGMKS